jgi:hypothetical protein
LAAVVGAASAPGTPGVTPTKWVANLLATTARAGTAHCTDFVRPDQPQFVLRRVDLGQLGPSMALAYPASTTDALRFSDFGAPVRIHAPPVRRLPCSSSVTVTLACRS